ncbi:hypothetical protein ACFPM7_01570 [Actinokineospora guangxiensis]|uniref:Uncharacterized protein n=1 Tax=Actinokineospora guangxiensis TaxID=1490288 RepID=A0ABW0EFI7_9PSEU
MSPDHPRPTGTAAADLLTLEFADPPPAAAGIGGPRESAAETHLIGPRGARPRGPAALDHLDPRMVGIIGRAGVGHVAAADATGQCDSAFREITVLDPRRIAYPAAGPAPAAVGVLLLDFTDEPVGLHVNGRAHAEGPWIVVEVEEARIHGTPGA